MIKNKYYLIFGAVISFTTLFLINDYVFRSNQGISAPTIIFWGLLGANVVISPFF